MKRYLHFVVALFLISSCSKDSIDLDNDSQTYLSDNKLGYEFWMGRYQ